MTLNEKYKSILSDKLNSELKGFEITRILCMMVKIKPEDYYKGNNMFEYQVYYTVSHEPSLRGESFTDEYFLENDEDYLILDNKYEEKDILYEGVSYTILDFNVGRIKYFPHTMFVYRKEDTLDTKWFTNDKYTISYTRKNLELMDKL